MALSQVRGSVVDNAAANKAAWSSTANAVDGSFGVNDGTYANLNSTTRNSTGEIDIGGFDGAGKFGDIPAGSTINSVTIFLRHYETGGSAWDSVNVGLFENALQIGTWQLVSQQGTATTFSTTAITPTLAELQSASFLVRVDYAGPNDTNTKDAYVDYVDIEVDYTAPAAPVNLVVQDSTHSSTSDSPTLIVAGPLIEATTHVGYRFRSDDSVGLNVDSGWNAAANTAGAIGPDITFRLRFAIDTDVDDTSIPVGVLQERHDLSGGTSFSAWTTVQNNATPDVKDSSQYAVQAVPSSQYSDLAATTDVLAQGTGTFAAGTGSHDNSVPSVSVSGGQHTEHEFAILIRKLSGEGHVPDGARYQFRILTGANNETWPVVAEMTVSNRPGHIGGTAVESPLRHMVEVGSSLYALSEYTDATDGTYKNEAVLLKSTDGGVSWAAMDESNRPSERDIETADLVYDAANSTIWWLHQGHSTDEVYLHSFSTATDTWGTTEAVATGTLEGYDKITSIHLRSDGSMIGTYTLRPTGTYNRAVWKHRSSGGTWTPAAASDGYIVDDTPAGTDDNNGVFSVLDTGGGSRSDGIHMFYIFQPVDTGGSSSNGILKHKYLTGPAHSTPDTLSAETDAATGLNGNDFQFRFMLVPPIIWNDGTSDRIGILWMDDEFTGTDPTPSRGKLWFTHAAIPTDPYWTTVDPWSWTTEQVTDGAAQAQGNGLGSRSVSAGLYANGTDVHAVWVDGNSGDIKMDVRTGGSWGTDTVEFSSFGAQLLRTFPVTGGIGIFTDYSPGGGTGHQRYDLISVDTAFAVHDATHALVSDNVTLSIPGGGPTIDWRAGEYTFHGSPSSPYDVTVNKPAGTLEGDLILVHLVSSSSSSSVDTVPEGWSTLTDIHPNVDYGWGVYAKVAGASEPSSWVWSYGGGGYVSSDVIVLSGTDGTWDTPVTTEVNSTQGVVATTPTVADSWLVTFAGLDASATYSWSNSSGNAVERTDTTDGTEYLSLASYTEPVTTPVEYSRTVSQDGSSQDLHVFVVAVHPTASPPVEELAYIWNGTSWVGASFWNGTSWRTDAKVWNGTRWVSFATPAYGSAASWNSDATWSSGMTWTGMV